MAFPQNAPDRSKNLVVRLWCSSWRLTQPLNVPEEELLHRWNNKLSASLAPDSDDEMSDEARAADATHETLFRAPSSLLLIDRPLCRGGRFVADLYGTCRGCFLYYCR